MPEWPAAIPAAAHRERAGPAGASASATSRRSSRSSSATGPRSSASWSSRSPPSAVGLFFVTVDTGGVHLLDRVRPLAHPVAVARRELPAGLRPGQHGRDPPGLAAAALHVLPAGQRQPLQPAGRARPDRAAGLRAQRQRRAAELDPQPRARRGRRPLPRRQPGRDRRRPGAVQDVLQQLPEQPDLPVPAGSRLAGHRPLRRHEVAVRGAGLGPGAAAARSGIRTSCSQFYATESERLDAERRLRGAAGAAVRRAVAERGAGARASAGARRAGSGRAERDVQSPPPPASALAAREPASPSAAPS